MSWGRTLAAAKEEEEEEKGKDEAEEFNAWSRVGEEASANQGRQRTTTTRAYGHLYNYTTTTSAITTTVTTTNITERHFQRRESTTSASTLSPLVQIVIPWPAVLNGDGSMPRRKMQTHHHLTAQYQKSKLISGMGSVRLNPNL